MATGDIKNRSMLQNTKTDVPEDEVNDLLPQDAHSPDVDDMLSSIATRGLDVVEGEPSPYSALEQRIGLAQQFGKFVRRFQR